MLYTPNIMKKHLLDKCFRYEMCILYENNIKINCMERDKENFDGWMIDYMAGRLSEEDLQQFHALLNSDVFYKKEI